MQLLGIHHLTAVTARIQANHAFYTQTLGLRLVKRSVNQDDVSAYHLFYADGVGSPGSDLTFFDWPVPPERRGTRSIARTFLRVAGQASLEWWSLRLRAAGLCVGELVQRDGRWTLDFDDPEGQRLSLIDDGGAGPAHPWAASPVPPDHQIRGLGPVLLSVPNFGPTERVLADVLGMRPVRDYRLDATDGSGEPMRVFVFEMGPGGAAAEVHVIVEARTRAAQPGAGGVHHVAFRTTAAEFDGWANKLTALGVPNSGEVDRYYFRSLYFREPNGILFEIATDEPGFSADEPLETMGQRLALPPFLEGRRAEIEAGLKPLGPV